MITSRKEFSLLIIVHAILAFALPFLVMFLSSCLEAEVDPIPFGPEETVQSVSTALDAPFAILDVESIQKNEFVHVETSQQVFGGTKFVTKDTGITVIDRVETADQIQLTLAFEEFEYDSDGNADHVIFEDSVNITKAASAATAFKIKPTLAKSEYASEKVKALSESVGLCEPVEHPNVTFHNLQVVKSSQEPPSKVMSGDFCTGKTPCSIQVTDISFDEVFWDGDEGTKVKCSYTYSTEVPYLASRMKFCMTLVVPTETRSLLLTECQEVQNFNEGTP